LVFFGGERHLAGGINTLLNEREFDNMMQFCFLFYLFQIFISTPFQYKGVDGGHIDWNISSFVSPGSQRWIHVSE
jgi:hypothetical protein